MPTTVAYPGFQQGGVLKVRPDTRREGGGGGAVGFWPDTKSGGGGGMVLSASGLIRKVYVCVCVGGYDRVSGGPGYSTVVEFMHAGINRQCNRAAIL